jgi:hypothetical protein
MFRLNLRGGHIYITRVKYMWYLHKSYTFFIIKLKEPLEFGSRFVKNTNRIVLEAIMMTLTIVSGFRVSH